MNKITWKCTVAVLSMFIMLLVVSGAMHAKEMKMQESSYAPVMITKSFEAVRAMDIMEKSEVMSKHMALLGERYDLSGTTSPSARMSGGKPLPVGPTAKLKNGMTWESLGSMLPEEVRQKDVFPYTPLPHVKHATGGMVVAPMQLETHPELVRFDVDFDLPEAFLPEFPPPLFLISRPDLGDVSGGEEITINNYYEKLNGILTPFQLEGMRILVTPVAQQQFNVTSDRKADIAQKAVSCFTCHTNGHSQWCLSP